LKQEAQMNEALVKVELFLGPAGASRRGGEEGHAERREREEGYEERRERKRVYRLPLLLLLPVAPPKPTMPSQMAANGLVGPMESLAEGGLPLARLL